MKPRLQSHYSIRLEPPASSGEEVLVFTSARRRIVVKGHSFREFFRVVVPLLDGRHAIEEIHREVADLFSAEDINNCLTLLSQHRLIEDAEALQFDSALSERLAPQLNYFREIGEDPVCLQKRLADSTVAVVGLGAFGAVAAGAMAATGVGRILCIDHLPVVSTDAFLSQVFSLKDVGKLRISVVRGILESLNPSLKVDLIGDPLSGDEEMEAAIAGSNFVLGCLDPGLSAFTYKLNRACLKRRIPWCSGEVSAFEGVVGPTVFPFQTACYLCYHMRMVACADDPQDALSGLKHLDRRKRDESSFRENLAFGTGIVGNMIALEAFKHLTGTRPSTSGKVVTLDFLRARSEHHVVLRKPWCPACFNPWANPVPSTPSGAPQ